jgi:Ring finger domain
MRGKRVSGDEDITKRKRVREQEEGESESPPSESSDERRGASAFRASMDYLGLFIETLFGAFVRRRERGVEEERSLGGEEVESERQIDQLGHLGSLQNRDREEGGLSSLLNAIAAGREQESGGNDLTLFIHYGTDLGASSAPNIVVTLVYYIYDERPGAVSLDRLNEKIPFSINSSEGQPDCPICMGAVEVGQKIRQLPCKHIYHTGCVDKWITSYVNECPLCRSIAVEGE